MTRSQNTKDKIHDVMHRYKVRKLHIGKSKHLVQTREQAVAIALSSSGYSSTFGIKVGEKGFLDGLFKRAKQLAHAAMGISTDNSVRAKVKAKLQGKLESHMEGVAIASDLKKLIKDKVKDDDKVEPPHKIVELSLEEEGKFKGNYQTKSKKTVRFQVNSDRLIVTPS